MAAAGRGASIEIPPPEPGYYLCSTCDTIPFGGVRDPLTSCQRPQRMRRVDEQCAIGARATLAARLDEAAAALISVIAHIELDRWRHIPAPGVWSIGKDAEHVIEAAGYHQWIVRLTIGQKVPSRRPVLERKQLTTDLSPQQAVALLRRRSDEEDRAPPRANGRAAEPAHSAAARPIPGARRDDRARPGRSLRRAPQRHRGEEGRALAPHWFDSPVKCTPARNDSAAGSTASRSFAVEAQIWNTMGIPSTSAIRRRDGSRS